MTDLLSSDGKLAFAPIRIYQIAGGLTLYCEDVIDNGDELVFRAENTAAIQAQPTPQGLGLNIVKMRDLVFNPSEIRVPKGSIMMTENTTDPALVQKIREVMSGLTLVKK